MADYDQRRREAHPRTLFHLVPKDSTTDQILEHPSNRAFVSLADDRLGLEIGYHVPKSGPGGQVITRLGRKEDLILPGKGVSRIHVSFQVHPDTLVVLLSVRAKEPSKVSVKHDKDQDAWPLSHGDCVLLYGETYYIQIVDYAFDLIWRRTNPDVALKDLVQREYRESLELARNQPTCDRPTEYATGKHSWHHTRLHSAVNPGVKEAPNAKRTLKGKGAFAEVYATLDVSGGEIAVKVAHLAQFQHSESARQMLHREVKALAQINHDNIIKCLGTANWLSESPEILFPIRPGNLYQLANDKDRLCDHDSLCRQVFEQMLMALDCLAHHGLCHRDVKPENILFYPKEAGHYHFELADFGLVNVQRMAKTFCGTPLFQAPELFKETADSPQDHKLDIWSLFATLMAVHPSSHFPPPDTSTPALVFGAIRRAAARVPEWADMAREDPTYRPTAAQLLVKHFKGRGRTTKGKVPPIPDLPDYPEEMEGVEIFETIHLTAGPLERVGAAAVPLFTIPRGTHKRHARREAPRPVNVASRQQPVVKQTLRQDARPGRTGVKKRRFPPKKAASQKKA